MSFSSVIEAKISSAKDISDIEGVSSRLSIVQVTSKRFSDEEYERLVDLLYDKKKEIMNHRG